MKYTITANYYKSGSGYSHSETLENGHSDRLFSAYSWNEEAEYFTRQDNSWVELVVSFYAPDADPMFDEPFHADSCII